MTEPSCRHYMGCGCNVSPGDPPGERPPAEPTAADAVMEVLRVFPGSMITGVKLKDRTCDEQPPTAP